MKSLLKTAFTACCAWYALVASPAAWAEEPFALAIVVSSNSEVAAIQQLNARDLELIYWKKKQYWPGGARIRPVNLHAEHPLRIAFSKTVLDSLPGEQADYWNGLYFHGTTPPYSVQSEEAVLRYVSITRGAIGYIDACRLDDRVKPVLWISGSNISNIKPAFNCAP